MAQSWCVPTVVQLAISALLLALAVARGGAPERILAGLLFAARVAQEAYETLLQPALAARRIEVGYLLIDLFLLVTITTVALRANRIYPLWIGAAQVAALVPHLVRAVLPKATPAVCRIMDGAAFDIQLVALALGLGFHIARRQRLARSYAGWQDSRKSTAF